MQVNLVSGTSVYVEFWNYNERTELNSTKLELLRLCTYRYF